MKTTIGMTKDDSQKRVTLPYIGEYLKDCEIEVQRDGNSFYADLRQSKDFMIRFEKHCLSVAVALPVDPDEFHDAMLNAHLTMQNTQMTKVFLAPGEEEMYIWFAVDSLCKTRGQFEELLYSSFKCLCESVRTYLTICEDVKESDREDNVVTFPIEQSAREPLN